MKHSIFIIILLLFLHPAIKAQTLNQLNYQSYLQLVFKQNLGYASEKLNIDISEAEIKAARIFSDPELSFEYEDSEDEKKISAGISKTFSVGKRKTRIDLAKSEKALNEALLDDYFHQLRSDATLAYLEILKQSELYHVKQNSYESIRQLATGDSIKFALGKITKVDAVQSGVEAGMAYNELIQAKTELDNAYTVLHLWMGVFQSDVLYVSSGSLKMEPRIFDNIWLLNTALENRSDLAAAMKNIDVADKVLKLTKRERGMDFDLSLGFSHNADSRRKLFNSPKFNSITAGIAMPLKFSNFNRGNIYSAKYQLKQAELNYQQAELEVQSEVTQNYRQYLSLIDQVARFENGLLNDAKLVLDGKIYSYDRGETSLLEVLDAQRTYNELQTSYIETLYNCATALVNLERSAGIWDMKIQ